MLNWTNRFNICCFLDNHHYHFQPSGFECIAAVNALHSLQANAGEQALDQLHHFQQQHNDWIFGHLGYDLKNDIEPLHSLHPDGIGFPDLFFFVPEIIVQLSQSELLIRSNAPVTAHEIFTEITTVDIKARTQTDAQLFLQSRFSQESYIETVETLKRHILRGDCYEINFCQEFYAEAADVNPLEVYQALSETSPNPFAAYYKINDRYMLCASPERYLLKKGDTIISQPIKGTSKRYLQDQHKDAQSREQLYSSSKERSENVMVVDLVRNDLSRVCEEGTVITEELFGIYSFPQVHQMISTIRGTLKKESSLVDIIKASFPMGSMTGAPKIKVMGLIEQYEKTRRGLFSGSVGYVTPEGDFDFNVVIRSIFYNASGKYLSFQVGSGITYYCDAPEEYRECLLKAEAIKKVLINTALFTKEI